MDKIFRILLFPIHPQLSRLLLKFQNGKLLQTDWLVPNYSLISLKQPQRFYVLISFFHLNNLLSFHKKSTE